MKSSITYSLLLAAAACGVALGQTTAYTTPVGYTTQTLAANKTTLVGFDVIAPSVVAGVFTGVSGATLTDSNANFGTLLTAGKTYVLDIKTGTAVGTVQEFVTWSGTSFTLPAAVTGTAIGDTYSVRLAPTLQETFPVGFLASSSSATNADKVWVPNGSGGYDRYYYRVTISPTGWRKTVNGTSDAGAAPSSVPLIYIDGLLVEKKGTAKDLVLSGEVKTVASNAFLITGMNPVSVTAPGTYLATSGLQGDIASSSSATNADKVWVPDGLGGYTKYYHRITISPTGWRKTVNGTSDAGAADANVALGAAVFIERKSTSKVVTFAAPASYSSL